MFDIGFWEFALIGIITLIIVGPEKMPAIARTAGRYIGKAKQFVAKVQEDIGAEIDTLDDYSYLYKDLAFIPCLLL
jgi:sec-independent protein translocase protein TatB